MMRHLVACPSCARHVRVSEAACPFCGVALAGSLRLSAPPRRPGVRLTRAALFALGTGTVALAPSCSSSSPGPVSGSAPVPDAAANVGDDDAANVIVADASGSPVSDAAGDDGSDGDEGPVDTPVYGGPGLGDDEPWDAVDANVGVDAADGSPGVGLNDAGDSGHD
jgi:hypothetical protein